MTHPDTRSALLALLGTGAELAQDEIARRLNVSVRTVRRHLTTLARSGLVHARRDGLRKRFHLNPEARSLPPLPIRLSEAEVEALTIAALAARPILTPTPFAESLALAAASLERAWLAEVFSFEPELESVVWDFDGLGPPDPFDATLFRTLLTAVRERIAVEADYYTASRQTSSPARRLHPLGFLVRGGSWLLVAFCCRDGRIKDFAVAGFRAAGLIAGDYFDRPSDFDLHLHARDRFRAIAGDDIYTVRLEVAMEAVPYFRRKAYHPTQQMESELGDGRAVVSFEVEGLEDVAAFVLSWGPKVRVLHPRELADRVADAHRRAVAQYDHVTQ